MLINELPRYEILDEAAMGELEPGGFSPASTLRVAASSVAPVAKATNAPCVLAPLGARDRESHPRPMEDH